VKIFKPNKTAWVGSQLSYRDHVSSPSEFREDLYCLTLAQSEALIAVIEHYRYLTRWIDDDEDNPLTQTLVMRFVDDTQRRLMMPCGSDNVIVLTQWTLNGHFQESTDDGATWHDAPNHDPRRNVPLPPPFLPPDTEDESCTYADSIVNKLINDWINNTGTTEDEATVIEGIVSFLGGVFGAFGVVAVAITLGIAIVIVAFTIAAWKAAFVSDVWDRLRCNLKDHMGSDGTFTQDQVDAIYDQIGTDETGIVRISLQSMIAALGTQGLTIAARAGHGAPDADCACDECDCPYEDWILAGTFVSCDGNSVTVDSVEFGGDQVVYMTYGPGHTRDPEICKSVTSTFDVTGHSSVRGNNACHTDTVSFVGANVCACQHFFSDSSPFQIQITYGDGCDDCT